MFKKSLIALLMSISLSSINAYAFNESSKNDTHTIEVADRSAQINAFATYCISNDDNNAFNAASDLVSDNWISSNDSDLIEDKEYRNLIDTYQQIYGDKFVIYTKKLNKGIVILNVNQEENKCGPMPMSDTSVDDILKDLKASNIDPARINVNKSEKSTAAFYLYNNTLIRLVSTEFRGEKYLDLSSGSLDKAYSEALRKKIEKDNE